ncbi:MAG: NAD(P)/FAD-dependent oxidoreductase [Verrucomicrobiota bacterium]
MNRPPPWDVAIVGAGLAGLSAAIYLGRALRRTLMIDDHRSLARWEPLVQNYLGFPDGVEGNELLARGRLQAERHGVAFVSDTIDDALEHEGGFILMGRSGAYHSTRVLLATGLYHLPPDIPGVDECLGRSMFFCKDCDAYRVRGKRIAIIGHNNEAIEYALAMVLYSPCVMVASNGKTPIWDEEHAQWIKEYGIPVYLQRVAQVDHADGKVASLEFADGIQFAVDSVFTTRGDIYHNNLARRLGAAVDAEGQVLVDEHCRTTVPGLYAAGCITAANCQMIIAAGQGATAAQAISRHLFEGSLQNHSLRGFRENQLQTQKTTPEVLH